MIYLSDYAKEGYRTLLFAERDISYEEYIKWSDAYH